MTREQAIDRLVEQDVARWGESEREAARRLHRGNLPTAGLAINALAARAELADVYPAYAGDTAALRALADATMTAADLDQLRKGG